MDKPPGHARKIRVLCVDDHRILREGITLIISQQPDMEVVGSAGTGEEAVSLFRRLRPDITLMDLQLPMMSGLEAIREIRREDANAHIIVLTMYKGDEDIYVALDAGATTYLLKDALSDDLIRVMREVHAGERPMDADVKVRLNQRAGQPSLTPREVEVLTLVYRGQRNKEIATSLEAAVNVALRRGIIHLM
jgi:DNA-binding NarL/FixJ family response regulator